MSCLHEEEVAACVGIKATFQATSVYSSKRMGIPPHCRAANVFQMRRSDQRARGREAGRERYQVNDFPTLVVFWMECQYD